MFQSMVDMNRRPRDERGRPPIVGLIGFARSGKDTVAARLVEQHGWTRFAFADALRRVALDTDPLVADWHGPSRLGDVVARDGWDRAKILPDVRRLLQALGVAVRTHIGPDTWVDVVLNGMYARGPVVITDVRFLNEAAAIRRHGGRLVRINRPGVDPVNSHVSETELALEPVDLTLSNAGSLDELHSAVDAGIATWHTSFCQENLLW
jgi:hypothetical protein